MIELNIYLLSASALLYVAAFWCLVRSRRQGRRSQFESYWWNAPEILPPVDCPLVLNLGQGYGWDIAHGERINHLADRGGVMDYRLSTGQVVRGRFAWSYP